MMRINVAAAVTAAFLCGCKSTVDPAYVDEIDAWHQERIERLEADEGWLTLAGLFWLKEGANTLGTDESSDIVFPAGSAPAKLGTVVLKGGVVELTVEKGVDVQIDGKPVRHAELKSDADVSPTKLRLGALTFYVIKRGERFGIRLKDRNSKVRRAFKGIDRYAVDATWRVEARFEPHPEGHTLDVPTIIGGTEKEPSPGAVVFERHGATLRLEAVQSEGSDHLFFIFADQTNGKETYGAGRFLYTDLPKDGKVRLDFNKAYNPPCAFTPYATCPLPPKGNRLATRVEAGERSYGHH